MPRWKRTCPSCNPSAPSEKTSSRPLRSYDPELGVVVAYGHILKPAILAIPRRGMLNVHASLLPKHRGPAPVQWSILNGDETTGVSIMQLEPGLDTGPVLHCIETEVARDETGGELLERLAELGAAALVEALTMVAGTPPSPSRRTTALPPTLPRSIAAQPGSTGDGMRRLSLEPSGPSIPTRAPGRRWTTWS